ncbi:hypothetical protein NMY22_g8293 [Coprinellus aureogranulatus]|nr:hypothetical protein NMY22_g8293 [Coprinellus aureogranulatus]
MVTLGTFMRRPESSRFSRSRIPLPWAQIIPPSKFLMGASSVVGGSSSIGSRNCVRKPRASKAYRRSTSYDGRRRMGSDGRRRVARFGACTSSTLIAELRKAHMLPDPAFELRLLALYRTSTPQASPLLRRSLPSILSADLLFRRIAHSHHNAHSPPRVGSAGNLSGGKWMSTARSVQYSLPRSLFDLSLASPLLDYLLFEGRALFECVHPSKCLITVDVTREPSCQAQRRAASVLSSNSSPSDLLYSCL